MSTNKNTKPRRKARTIGGVIFLIAIVVFVGLFLWGYFARTDHTNEMLKKGCQPASFDRYGLPTVWRCPAGVS